MNQSVNISNFICTEEMETTLSVLDIKEGTSVDGPGLRTSIYFAGCIHKCHGCHNPQSWNIVHGTRRSVAELIEIIKENDFDVTFSGGDPLFQIEELIILARVIKKMLNKNIWCYTGYSIEEIKSNDKLSPILACIDTLVDGKFIQSKRDVSLKFRGSSNQRIINASDFYENHKPT